MSKRTYNCTSFFKTKTPNKLNINLLGIQLVGPLGLEPRMTVPKTGVLPLHHGPIPLRACKFKTKFDLNKHFLIQKRKNTYFIAC